MVLQTNGIELHYEVTGEGEPLLWLHGFFGIGTDWQYIFKAPPPGYRLIAPDLRGHGRSTLPSGLFTFREAADDVRALLRHLEIDRVKAIGLSGGGITLFHLAEGPGPIVDSANSAKLGGNAGSGLAVEAMVVVSAPDRFPERARALQRLSSEATLSDAARATMRQRHSRGDAQIASLFAASRAFADDRDDVNFTPDRLATITAETLIVFGDRDPFYPVSIALDLATAIPRSYLWVVPNGGHGPVFGDAAPRFAETALAFLGGGWRPASPSP